MKLEFFSCTSATKLIYLITFTNITYAFNDISSLRVVCDIRYGEGDVKLNNLPPACTAAASSYNNISVVSNMTQVPRTVPFLLYFNKYNYLQWGDVLHYADDFVKFMLLKKLDGLIFNNMYNINTKDKKFDDQRNQNMYDFFSRLKELNPDGLYGLAIPGHAEVLPEAFNYDLLDPVVDFYVVKTISFRRCKYKDPMSRTSTKGDMQKVLDAIDGHVDMSKVLLTSQLFGEGITRYAKHGAVILSYSDLCGGKDLSNNRKYCKDSMRTIWNKASLCHDYKMLGVYIKYVDCDDVHGFCHCSNNEGLYKFPGLDALVGGSYKENQSNYICESFGNRIK